MVSLTQFDSIGTVVIGNVDEDGKYALNVKLGARDDDSYLLVLARQLIESVHRVSDKRLVLTVAARPACIHSIDGVRARPSVVSCV